MIGEEKLQLLVVGISEGRYFPARPGHSLVVESTFSGKSLSTDSVPHHTSPHINTELCWEISQKQLQQHRLHRTPLKLIVCAFDNRTKAKEQVGYLLLDLRTAQQRPAKGHWVRLLNVSYPRLKPELFLLLTQELAEAQDSVGPSLLTQPDHSAPQPVAQSRLPRMTLDPKHGYFIVEEDQEDKNSLRSLFALTFTIQSVLHPQNYPAYGSSHSDASLQLVYSLLGSQIQSEVFSLTLGAESERTDQQPDSCGHLEASTTFKPERITMRIFSSRESLYLLLTGHSPVALTLLSEEHPIASGEVHLSELADTLTRPYDSLPTQIERHIRLMPSHSVALNEQLISLSVSASLRMEESGEYPVYIESKPETNTPIPPPFPDLDDLLPPVSDPPSPLLYSPDPPPPPLPLSPDENMQFCFTIDIPTITNLSLPPSGVYSLNYLYPFFSVTQPIEIPLPHPLTPSQPQRIHSSCCLFDLSSPLSLLMEHTQTEPLLIQLYSQSQPLATSTVLLSSVFSHAVSSHTFSHSMSSPLLSRSGTVAELQINLSLAPAPLHPPPPPPPPLPIEDPLPVEMQPLTQIDLVPPPQPEHIMEPAPTSALPHVTHISPIHHAPHVPPLTHVPPASHVPPPTYVPPAPHVPLVTPAPPVVQPQVTMDRVLGSDAYREALQLELWKEREESEFREKMRGKETQLLERLAQEWSRQEAGKRDELDGKSRQLEELQSELKNGLEEVRERSVMLDGREQELMRREQSVSIQIERWEGDKESLRREVTADYEQKLSVERGRLLLADEKIKTMQERLGDVEHRLSQREVELHRVTEESRTKPEARLQAELTVAVAEKGKLEQQLSQALQAKQQYRQQWGRALQELAKMRQQEYAASQAKLRQEQQELEQLRHAYMQREETQGIAHELQRTRQELEQLQATSQSISVPGSVVLEGGGERTESLNLSGPARESTTRDELEGKIARWVEQRNILLQTGVYSSEDPTIRRLDENINAALKAKK